MKCQEDEEHRLCPWDWREHPETQETWKGVWARTQWVPVTWAQGNCYEDSEETWDSFSCSNAWVSQAGRQCGSGNGEGTWWSRQCRGVHVSLPESQDSPLGSYRKRTYGKKRNLFIKCEYTYSGQKKCWWEVQDKVAIIHLTHVEANWKKWAFLYLHFGNDSLNWTWVGGGTIKVGFLLAFLSQQFSK